jgi:hypothetical protein
MLNSKGDLALVGCSPHGLARQLGFAYESAHTNSAFGAAIDVYSPNERSECNCSGVPPYECLLSAPSLIAACKCLHISLLVVL